MKAFSFAALAALALTMAAPTPTWAAVNLEASERAAALEALSERIQHAFTTRLAAVLEEPGPGRITVKDAQISAQLHAGLGRGAH